MNIHSWREVTDITDAVKKQVTLFNESAKKPYKISFSIGQSIFRTKHETIDDFLKKIDRLMYEDKKRKAA